MISEETYGFVFFDYRQLFKNTKKDVFSVHLDAPVALTLLLFYSF